MKNPILSVCIITYNHSKHIKDAIEGVLMQKVNFTWELIIADDFSTDGTRDILIDYRNRFPEFIKLILQEKNIGAANNWIELLSYPKSKYIAYLEGDDYWIDPLKLQKQFDFMEHHPDYSLCFHNAVLMNEKTNISTLFGKYSKKEYFGNDIIKKWLIPTASSFFLNIIPTDFPAFIKKATHGDLALFLYLANYGRIGYLNEVMCVYRVNSLGITQLYFNGVIHNQKHVEQIDLMIDYFGVKYKKALKERAADYMLSSSYLYAKECNLKMSKISLKRACSYSLICVLKNIRYLFATIYYQLKC